MEAKRARYFVVSFLLFAFAIIHSLTSILVFDQDTPVVLGSPLGFILVLSPLYWMTAGILSVGFLVWKLYAKKT